MRPRTLLVLTVLVAALGAFIWFFERKQPTTDEAKAEEKKVLAGVAADDVREVTIVREGKSVHLVREGGAKPVAEETKADDEMPDLTPPAEWRLTAPLAARADRSAVEGLIASVLALEKARTFEKADRKTYGLAPPAAEVTLVTVKDGTTTQRTLEIGSELAGTDQRAVALAGKPEVQVVPGAFWSDVSKAPGEWRSKELFAGTREDVERVTLAHGADKVLLARRGEEPWLEAPLADRADSERFDQLVDALTGLQAVAFLDTPPGPPETLGLAPPQDVVEVVRKGQARPFRLELGDSRGEGEDRTRYARVDGQLVTLKAPPLDEAAARPAQDWRARAWSSFAVYEVDRLDVKDGHGPLSLTRADADWKRGNAKIFSGTVADLLGAVADAKADRVLDPARAAGLAAGAPALTLELVGAAGKKQTLTLWPPLPPGAAAGEGAPARASGRDAVLLLPAALPADLATKIAAIRNAEPMKEPTPTPTPKP
jgi:hypothetical protein